MIATSVFSGGGRLDWAICGALNFKGHLCTDRPCGCRCEFYTAGHEVMIATTMLLTFGLDALVDEFGKKLRADDELAPNLVECPRRTFCNCFVE